jgi:biotin transport system permease protein
VSATALGGYLPRDSVVHAAPAPLKLLLVAGLITALAVFPRPVPLAVSLLVVALMFPIARLGPRYLWRALRPALFLGAVLTVFHLVTTGWQAAIGPVGQLLVGVVVANLLVFTTRVSDLVALFGRWPRVELLLALTIRSIPEVAAVVRQTREAAWARGQRTSVVRVLPTVLVRLIRDADLLGEALSARGL